MNFARIQVNAIIRQVLFIGVLILLGAIIFNELKFFLGAALGALTFYVLLRLPYAYLVVKRRWNRSVAALSLILLLVIILLVFGWAAFEMVLSKMSDLSHLSVENILNSVGIKIKQLTGFEIYSSKLLDQAKQAFMERASGFLDTAYSFVANLAMMIFMLYFLLVNHRKMERGIIKYIPFKGDTLARVLKEVKAMIVSNAVGIPTIMIVQGIVATLGYWIFGVENPLFWGVITGFFSILPIIGTTAIWGILCIFLLTSGEIWQSIGLLIYCVTLVSGADNVIRILLGKFMADVHPLITILGVIMGMNLFGFWGIIFGPLMINLSILLFKIYRLEYLHEKEGIIIKK